jgi:copper chaperone CopZ
VAAAGVPETRLAQVRVPAGLDIGARTPDEIAVSILAEVIQVMRRPAPAARPAPPPLPDGLHVETLAVEDMTCSHCVQTVRKTLETVEGVAVLDVALGSARIAYDPAQVDRRQVVEALAERGYPVSAECEVLSPE